LAQGLSPQAWTFGPIFWSPIVSAPGAERLEIRPLSEALTGLS
jgi:hypothetical protein